MLTWTGANSFVNKKLDFDLIETYDPDRGIKILKYFYSYIPSLYKEAAQYKPDVIIQACAGLNTGIMAFIAGRLNIPFIYRCANDIDSDARYKSTLFKYEQIAYKFGLKRANAIVCQNRYQHASMKEAFPEKPLYILHNPFLKDSDAKINLYENRKYVAWLGVFQRQKNLSLLYDIAKKCPEITFQIAGMPGKSMDSHTEGALASLKKLSNVEFTGYLPRRQIPQFLSKAVALLNTSHYEGFSNTFLEAFSVGTPVIALEKVDPDNIITTNRLGFTAKKDDEIAGLIEHVFELEENECSSLSKRCRAFVQERHDPVKMANELTRILSSLVKHVHD